MRNPPRTGPRGCLIPGLAAYVVLFWLIISIHAQSVSLTLDSASAGPGGTLSLNLVLNAGSTQPAAGQWTLTYDPASITGFSISNGAGALAASKSLACSNGSGTSTCLVSGLNQNLIAPGTVAVVNVTLSGAASGTVTIGVTGVVAAAPDGSSVAASGTGGNISLVLPNPLSMACNPTSLNSASTSTCTVTLAQPASTGGAMVSLSSNNARLSVPASVMVPAGSSSANFTATAGTITADQSAVVTATLNSGSTVTTTLSLVAPPSVSGVLSISLFGGSSAVAPGSWIEVHGSNLAAVSRSWTLADFKGVVAPTSLEGSSVAISGQPAAIASISPTMLLVQVPSQVAPGSQSLIVQTAVGTTSPFTVTVNPLEPGVYAPAFLLVGGNQYTSEFNDFMEWVLPTGASAGTSSRPARAGDFIVVWGVGFGPVTPNVPTGTIVQGLTTLTTPVQFSIGGVPATVLYQGLAPGEIGLYQFDLVVPNNVAAGNLVPLTFTQGGVSGTQTLYVAIQP
jgi:uncharacterized protein (TIGR03437 family)